MAGRGSRHHYALNSARWQRVRRQALARDGWRCCQCGRAGRLEVDHVRALRNGGEAYSLGNLQALCRSCHIEKTRSENRREPTPAETAWRELVAELASQAASR